MYQVNWTPIAKETHRQIFDFIIEQWSIDTAIQFDDQLQDLLYKLEKHPFLCPPLKGYKNIHRCVISKQVSLLYRVNTQRQTTDLLTFFDNRANHPYQNL